jgi:hypothetical protein
MNVSLSEDVFWKTIPPASVTQLSEITKTILAKEPTGLKKVSLRVPYSSELTPEIKESDSAIIFGDILVYWLSKHELFLNGLTNADVLFEKYANLNPDFKFQMTVNNIVVRLEIEEFKLYEIIEEYFNKFLFKKPTHLSSFELSYSYIALEFTNTTVLNKDSIRKR